MERSEELKQRALDIRRLTVECIGTFGMGHIGGCLSIADALAVLYFDRMNIRPDDPAWPQRDRFVLSKGHAGPALYATLACKGYFPRGLLATLNQPDTLLPSHCDRTRTPGVDMTAGSLGQGLSAAVGMALGARLDGRDLFVYAMLGEGDCQEGSTWEAAMYAAQRKLGRLVVLVDANGLQIDGPVNAVNALGDLAGKWEAFGWNATVVEDGHDVDAIRDALEAVDGAGDRPTAIVLRTVKGKGVPFMEDRAEFHHAPLSAAQVREALEALGSQGGMIDG